MDPKKKAEFEKKLKDLMDEMEVRLIISPKYVPRDDGSWSTVVSIEIGDSLKQEQL